MPPRNSPDFDQSFKTLYLETNKTVWRLCRIWRQGKWRGRRKLKKMSKRFTNKQCCQISFNNHPIFLFIFQFSSFSFVIRFENKNEIDTRIWSRISLVAFYFVSDYLPTQIKYIHYLFMMSRLVSMPTLGQKTLCNTKTNVFKARINIILMIVSLRRN